MRIHFNYREMAKIPMVSVVCTCRPSNYKRGTPTQPADGLYPFSYTARGRTPPSKSDRAAIGKPQDCHPPLGQFLKTIYCAGAKDKMHENHGIKHPKPTLTTFLPHVLCSSEITSRSIDIKE